MRAWPILLALALAPAAAHAQPKKPAQTVVVLKAGTAKGPIAPYEEAAKGFRELVDPVAEILVTPEITQESIQSVQQSNPELIVAFGAEAAQFAERNFPAIPRVIALAPGVTAATSSGTRSAVISTDIAADLQVRWIDDTLPDVRKIGVFFDPAASQARIDELIAAAKSRPGAGVEIVPLPVSTEGEIPALFRKSVKAREIDALLFVPDRLVISRGTISFLLKETLAANIPVIGFNSYFVDNGAVLGFGLDYHAAGRQAAEAARAMPQRTESWVAGPKKITIWINKRVADKLRIRTAYDPFEVEEIR